MQVFCGCCKNVVVKIGSRTAAYYMRLAKAWTWLVLVNDKNGALHARFVRNNMLCKNVNINSGIFNLKAISSLKKLIGIRIFHI
jgi:hypothetical protein